MTPKKKIIEDRCQCHKNHKSQQELKLFPRSLKLLGVTIPTTRKKTQTKKDLRARRCRSAMRWADISAKIQTRQIYRSTSMYEVTRVIHQLKESNDLSSLKLDQEQRKVLNNAIYEEWYDKNVNAKKERKNHQHDNERQRMNVENFPYNLHLLRLLGTQINIKTDEIPTGIPRYNLKAENGPSRKIISRMKFRSTFLDALKRIIPNLEHQSNLEALLLNKEQRKILNQIIYEEWIEKKNREEQRQRRKEKTKKQADEIDKKLFLRHYFQCLKLLGVKIAGCSINEKYQRNARSSSSLNWQDTPAKVQTRILSRSVSLIDLTHLIPRLNDPQEIDKAKLEKWEASLLSKAIYEEWYKRKEELLGKVSKNTRLNTGMESWETKDKIWKEREEKIMKDSLNKRQQELRKGNLYMNRKWKSEALLSWRKQKDEKLHKEREEQERLKCKADMENARPFIKAVTRPWNYGSGMSKYKADMEKKKQEKENKKKPLKYKAWLKDVEERESKTFEGNVSKFLKELRLRAWNYGGGLYHQL